MEPLVTDSAKEEVEIAKIVRNILLLIIQFLSRSLHNFFSEVNSTEGVLPNNEFRKKFILHFLKDP